MRDARITRFGDHLFDESFLSTTGAGGFAKWKIRG